MNDVYGVILCGNVKSNIQELTGSISPPMIKIKDDYTVLDKQIFQFKCADIDNVYLIAKKECVKELSGIKSNYEGINIEIIKEDNNMGSVGALINSMELLDGDIVMRNSDIVTDINLSKFVNQSRNNNYPVTIFITKLPSPYGIVKLNYDRVVGFEEKPILDSYINAGIYYIKKGTEVPEIYKSGRIEYTVFPEMVKKKMMGCYEEDVFWRSLKTWRDLEIVRKEFKDKIDKAWGYEKVLVHTNKYLTKELFLREGFQTSYHQHEEKDETMYVNYGRGYIKFDDDVKYYSKNDKINIKPKTPHSIVALENTLLYEFSTPHINDTTRINDYYPRDTE